MKVTKAQFVYGLICDSPVCLALNIASNFVSIASISSGHLTFDWTSFNWLAIAYNFPIALIIAMLISCFIPLARIGKWFVNLFHFKKELHYRDFSYRLLSLFAATLVFFIIITPPLNIINSFIVPAITGNELSTIKDALIYLAKCTPVMIIVGYVVSVISDIPAYAAAHKIDKDF